jgi:hypothetical protein
MQENWLWGFDQFINNITTTRGESMSNLHEIYDQVSDLIDDNDVCDIQLQDGTLLEQLTAIQNALANYIAKNREDL